MSLPVNNSENESRWLINPDGYYPECEKCHYEPYRPESNVDVRTDYCPGCGRKMTK